MKKHCLSACCDDTNESLDNTILPVSANTAERLVLVRGIDVVLENFGSKDSIVTVDMFDMYIVTLSKGFKSYLRF